MGKAANNEVRTIRAKFLYQVCITWDEWSPLPLPMQKANRKESRTVLDARARVAVLALDHRP
jgi:hypothetical protein